MGANDKKFHVYALRVSFFKVQAVCEGEKLVYKTIYIYVTITSKLINFRQ